MTSYQDHIEACKERYQAGYKAGRGDKLLVRTLRVSLFADNTYYAEGYRAGNQGQPMNAQYTSGEG